MFDNSLYVTDLNGLKRLAEVISNISHTNLFPVVLSDDNYKRINDSTFQKGAELIEIANIRGEWRYRNKNCEWDTGNIVQFIANRYQEGLRKCGDLSVLHVSAFIAKQYYEDLKKAYRKEHKKKDKMCVKSTENQSRNKI
ncbi:hypothetical protein [Chitinophaga sp. Ak27]|uniref:hypothetical protein n=1 Tax=Chitinophaga sp. Ak27 TaxID=2726116 RepID=UPI00145F4601|nr:hypothetical protein [Chitinophaga sp. Ak27]NLU91395.1 hypothetical protein [Chitinophaga sp. Ak27]